MKAITLLQPYAQLIAVGVTPYHALTWEDEYRGPVAIHASTVKSTQGEQIAQEREFYDALKSHKVSYDQLPFGKVIATAELVAVHHAPYLVHHISRLHRKLLAGRPHTHRYIFEFGNLKLIKEPSAHKDGKELWEWQESAAPAADDEEPVAVTTAAEPVKEGPADAPRKGKKPG